MTCLSIVQSVCKKLAIGVPTVVVGSTDPQIIQLLELLNEEGQSQAEGTNWQALTLETSFTTVATEIQGTLATICPGLKFIINDTIWNRDLRRPVFGPLGPQLWQQQKAMFMQGPWSQYRIVGNNIKFVPVPAAGQSCYFEYVSKNWCTDSTGATTYSSFNADADVGLLDEQILAMGLIWRWKMAKGLEFDGDFQKYQGRLTNAIARDGAKPVLNMGQTAYDIYPGVYVPAGNWGT